MSRPKHEAQGHHADPSQQAQQHGPTAEAAAHHGGGAQAALLQKKMKRRRAGGHGGDHMQNEARVHVAMGDINHHDAASSDGWRLGLHGGPHEAGDTLKEEQDEAAGNFTVGNPALLSQGKYLVDNKGNPMTSVPLPAGTTVKLNAGTFEWAPIDGADELCTFVWNHALNPSDPHTPRVSGLIPIKALKDGHRIAGVQEAIAARLQSAIGKNGQRGATLAVHRTPYPAHWDQQIPHPWKGPLRTMRNQGTDQPQNRAAYYFGGGIYASPPNPDYGVQIDMLADTTEFHPSGEEHFCPLYYSRDPKEKRPTPEAPHQIHFIKGFAYDAKGNKIHGWVNRLELAPLHGGNTGHGSHSGHGGH